MCLHLKFIVWNQNLKLIQPRYTQLDSQYLEHSREMPIKIHSQQMKLDEIKDSLQTELCRMCRSSSFSVKVQQITHFIVIMRSKISLQSIYLGKFFTISTYWILCCKWQIWHFYIYVTQSMSALHDQLIHQSINYFPFNGWWNIRVLSRLTKCIRDIQAS